MLKFAPKSLAPKLLLVTGAIIAILLIASNFVLISQTRDRVGSLIGQQAETEAKAIAQGIVTDTSALASAARTMRIWTDGRSEVVLGFYLIAWVVGLVLTHMLSR